MFYELNEHKSVITASASVNVSINFTMTEGLKKYLSEAALTLKAEF